MSLVVIITDRPSHLGVLGLPYGPAGHSETMRIVVTGATGNVGTAVVRALVADPAVTSVVAIARRRRNAQQTKVEQVAADVAADDLVPLLRGAAAVVHLAWRFQPTRDPVATWRANVLGSIRVFQAAVEAGVPTLVYASSVGAYSPASNDTPVDESWPTDGWPGAAYTREKAYLERVLDAHEATHPEQRVVRIRPAFVFQRSAASAQRRLFAGPLPLNRLLRPGFVPALPDPGLRFQAVHADDLADVFRRVIQGTFRGPVNVAAAPVLGIADVARLLRARTVPVPAAALRAIVAAGWRLRLVPASPDLFDAALRLPIMDTTRAHTELGWRPRRTAIETVAELLGGLTEEAGADTPPLAAGTSRPAAL